ncbi:DUF1048 domain-containing protein [Lactococcus fujiensis]|uniref:DUF1048 domain-containing protein n=1 Tax=Lactococcus fujiensis JCM 16395 TaxID=1291764 RepID=A0A2A5RMW6_9LACT|nr:DUF1048 domain-containing protein [Lactococcus fujiensis]PCS00648.1 hypothetical protein RT41_GL001030 [Lactococcus fujiensis JCM 16395]
MTLIDKLFGEGTSAQKHQWGELQKRVKALPSDYYQAYRAIEKYLFNMGIGDTERFSDLVEFLEVAASENKKVTEVIGADVAAFCDAMLNDDRMDWKEKYRKSLNDYFSKR